MRLNASSGDNFIDRLHRQFDPFCDDLQKYAIQVIAFFQKWFCLVDDITESMPAFTW